MRCGVAKTARKGREIGGYIAQIDMKIFDPPTPISRKNSFNSSAEGRYGSPTSMQTCSRWSTEQRPLLSGYVFRRDSAAATGASMARLTGNMFVFAKIRAGVRLQICQHGAVIDLAAGGEPPHRCTKKLRPIDDFVMAITSAGRMVRHAPSNSTPGTY
jgi:hypothetical protein